MGLPVILHFVLSELCHEYNMKFTSVTFISRRSGCGKAGRKVYWFFIRFPKNFTLEKARHSMSGLLVRFPLSVHDVKTWRETWNFLMIFAFRLRFTREFVSLAGEVPHEPLASLLIFRVSLCFFFQCVRTPIFDDIQHDILCSIFREQNHH